MRISNIRTWADSHQDLFLDIVRIYLGIALFIKGLYFIKNREELLQILQNSADTFIAPGMIAHYVIPAHLVGGALLAAGLLTRFAAILQLPVLAGAVFFVYAPQVIAFQMTSVGPRQSLELAALVLFLLTLVAVFGAGRLSVDHWLSRRAGPAMQPQAA
jgi:putative oxidoreductase